MAGGRDRGFVLVATLWVLAIVTLAATYFSSRVDRARELARQRQDSAEQQVAFANTRAEVLLRLVTMLPTHRGFGQESPLALDDRPYRGTGGETVQLQDNLGLLNVNNVQPILISRFLAQMGVPFERRDALVDALRDYQDRDDLRRLNGAEAVDYAALRLPPPPNDWLIVPEQLRNVIGWRDYIEPLEGQGILRNFTTNAAGVFNPNTAPLEVLASLPGLTRETAASLLKMRNVQPFLGTDQMPGYVAGLLDQEFLVFFPGASIRITQHSRRLPWSLVTNVTLTPLSDRAPWRVDYSTRTAVSYAFENEDKIPDLPRWVPATDPEAP